MSDIKLVGGQYHGLTIQTSEVLTQRLYIGGFLYTPSNDTHGKYRLYNHTPITARASGTQVNYLQSSDD